MGGGWRGEDKHDYSRSSSAAAPTCAQHRRHRRFSRSSTRAASRRRAPHRGADRRRRRSTTCAERGAPCWTPRPPSSSRCPADLPGEESMRWSRSGGAQREVAAEETGLGRRRAGPEPVKSAASSSLPRRPRQRRRHQVVVDEQKEIGLGDHGGGPSPEGKLGLVVGVTADLTGRSTRSTWCARCGSRRRRGWWRPPGSGTGRRARCRRRATALDDLVPHQPE